MTGKQKNGNRHFVTQTDGNKITEVTVFHDHAFVKRSAHIHLAQDLHHILMEVTAFDIDPDTVQAVVLGRGEIYGVQYKAIPVIHSPQGDIRDLEADRKAFSREKKALLNRLETLDKQKGFLDAFIRFSEVQVPREIKTRLPEADQIENTVSTLGKGYADLFEKEKLLQIQLEELNEKIDLVEANLARVRKPGKKIQKAIEVVFESIEEQQVRVEVSYLVRRAAWYPFYKANVSAQLTRVDLTLYAGISQKTGENWKGVDLSVSNALPMKTARLPEPGQWIVAPWSAHPLRFSTAGPPVAGAPPMAVAEGDAEITAAALDDLAAPEAPAPVHRAEEKKLPQAFEYQFSRPMDLPPDGDESILPLFSKPLESRFFVYAVPAADPLAYLVCEAAHEGNLMAAPFNIHFDGRFVGTTRLSEKKAGQELLLNLGPDRGIRISRKKITDKVSETFFGKVDRATIVREIAYAVKVENLKDEKTMVRVYDAVPVSTTDRIQLKGIQLDPKPLKQDIHDQEGVMMWEVFLTPGQTQTIRISFGVKYPKSVTPAGLS